VHSCLSCSGTVFSSNSSARFNTRHTTCTNTHTLSNASRQYCEENMHASSSYLECCNAACSNARNSPCMLSSVCSPTHNPSTAPDRCTHNGRSAYRPSTEFASPPLSSNPAVHRRLRRRKHRYVFDFIYSSFLWSFVRLIHFPSSRFNPPCIRCELAPTVHWVPTPHPSSSTHKTSLRLFFFYYSL
jgi:hypothetical protein